MWVKQVDYDDFVNQMAAAGQDGMEEVLSRKFDQIGQPETNNELCYFWIALIKAARLNDEVWQWLCEAANTPSERELNMLSQSPLPVIGGPDDRPYQPTAKEVSRQAVMLDLYLRQEGRKKPMNRCKTIQEYVRTFCDSDRCQRVAGLQLMKAGFHALATCRGIKYLIKTYSE